MADQRTWQVWICELCDAIEQREEGDEPFLCVGFETKHRQREMQAATVTQADQVEALRRAVNSASYALSPNQGESPNPALAQRWLHTTFPPDHPNYVDPASL